MVASAKPQVALLLASGVGIAGHAVSDYCTRMDQATERIFFQKYVAKEFTQKYGRAREQLVSVKRKALYKMEDQPVVDRFVMQQDVARRTICGVHVRQRQRQQPGQRAVDRLQRSWECKDYMQVRTR